MTAPAQRPLFTEPERCPTCGRDWGELLQGGWLRLDRLAWLEEEDFAAALRCWTGACLPRPR